MAFQLLLLREPRTLVLASPTYSLLFSSPPSPSPSTSSSSTEPVNVVLKLLPTPQINLDNAVVLAQRAAGCMGIISIAGDTFLAIITQATSLGSASSSCSPTDSLGCESINRILSVDFFCLTSPAFDYLHAPSTASYNSPLPLDHSEYIDAPSSPYQSSFSSSTSSLQNGGALNGVSAASLRGSEPTTLEHPCQSIRKILSNSSFYYSHAFDISTRLQARVAKHAGRTREGARHRGTGGFGGADSDQELDDDETKQDEDGYAEAALDHDARFLWNSYMVAPLLTFRSTLSGEMRGAFDGEGFAVLAIQGFAGRQEVNLGGQIAVLSLISRLSHQRSGTRFNVRGVDDSGSVANFVETETILRTKDLVFSFVQTRGSVPLFWEEGGQAFGVNPKITITRPIEASLPAFLRHFEDMLEHYDKVHIINLLGTKEGEAALTSAYTTHLRAASTLDENIRSSVAATDFDFHYRAKISGIETVSRQLAREIGEVEEGFGACVVGVTTARSGENGEREEGGEMVMRQQGTFRTNCKDCLDRTNAVEDSLSRAALESFLQNTQPNYLGSDAALWASHRVLWADNGDALSKIYVGTGAINTSFTRTGKKSLAGMLSDATKSVSRVYQQQFVDGGKQRAIDALLGNLSTSRKVRIFNPIHDELRSQLRARSEDYTSYDNTTLWVGTYNLNGKPPGSESLLPWLFPVDGHDPAFLVVAFQEIVPLTAGQIMATDPEKKRKWEQHITDTLSSRPDKKSDYILLRSEQLVGTALLVFCRTDVAGEVRNVEAAIKKTGLKGMAGNKGAVAIRLDYRNTSFCFLTAHLAAGHSNVEERNQDYFTIANGLHFARGRTLAHHDNIVWAADTNYRISLPNEEVRGLAEADAYDELYEADQLNHARQSRGVFKGYEEAAILFRPTYKYDNGSDVYDSSEKNRIPAFTDRILYKGKGENLDAFRYQRAELKASDHRPIYALFRARIRSVDEPKRAALRKRLVAEIIADNPQEKLDGKPLPRRRERDLPPPSDDSRAWWNEPDGSFKPPPLPPRPSNASSNPFYVPPPSSASDAASRSQRRPPPSVPSKPTPPPRAPSLVTGDLLGLDDLSDALPTVAAPAASKPPPAAFQTRRKPPPPMPRSTSPISVRSADTVAGTGIAGEVGGEKTGPPPVPRRPAGERGASGNFEEVASQATGGSWTVI